MWGGYGLPKSEVVEDGGGAPNGEGDEEKLNEENMLVCAVCWCGCLTAFKTCNNKRRHKILFRGRN